MKLVEELLAETIEAAKRAGVIKASSAKQVIADTTIMEKAIAHPTDSCLLERCRQHLVKAAACHGLTLRQNYNREAPRLAGQIGRYAHAKQFRRMKKSLRTLRSRVGRVMRDVERQRDWVSGSARAALDELISHTKRILTQKPKNSNKLYALHAPEVECISKGKARKPYKFGVKVLIVTTHREGLVIGMRSMPDNPYDGHTLAEALEQAHILSDMKIGTAFVDRGYRGVEIEGVKIWHSGLRRGVTRTLRAMIRRRSAIEPAIGHMKSDGKLGRNWLRGASGDALHAVLCDAGHNLRMILRKLRLFCALILAMLYYAYERRAEPVCTFRQHVVIRERHHPSHCLNKRKNELFRRDYLRTSTVTNRTFKSREVDGKPFGNALAELSQSQQQMSYACRKCQTGALLH